jgi:hypothetical protein
MYRDFVATSRVLSVINTSAGLVIHCDREGIHFISYWDNDGNFLHAKALAKRMDLEAYIQAQEILDEQLMSFK